jgi:hypothetical protein
MAYLPKCLISSVLVILFTLGGCGESSPSGGNESLSIRGVRYCEVLAVKNEGGLSADVYGTQGLSDCPLSQWEALDPDAIQQELGALAIVMNGPRFWLIDTVTAFSELGEARFFGELEMRLIASVALSPGELSQDPYQERRVVRDTEFVFVAGSEVYELIAPGGKVYVMQSYAHIVDDTLDEPALPSLGEELQLPEGWTYRTRVLDEDYVVVDQDGIATVVQDELQNTYQFAGLLE